jgi:hypothetical protein
VAQASCEIVIVLQTVVSLAYLDIVSFGLANNVDESPTCIEASDRSGLFAFRCDVPFEATLYPIAILESDPSCLYRSTRPAPCSRA